MQIARSNKARMVAASLVALAVTAVVAFVAASGPSRASKVPTDGARSAMSGTGAEGSREDPYRIGGEQVSPDVASSRVEFPVLAPSRETGVGDLSGVWAADYDDGDGQVVLEYDGGRVWIEENPVRASETDGGQKRFEYTSQHLNEELGREVMHVGSSGGSPTMWAEANTDANKDNAATVEIVADKTDVVIYSHEIDAEGLTGILATLEPLDSSKEG